MLAKGLAALVFSLLLVVLLAALLPLPEGGLEPAQAYRFYDKNDQLIHTLISQDEFVRMHVPFERISPLFIDTLLLQEDRYYYQHLGVNPLAIMRAAVSNIAARRVVSGGSTITMQLARMLERRERTLWAKMIEAFRALQLEMRYSKQEILAYYLAKAPYGGNLEGLQAAAFSYFGKPAALLSPGEIALLVCLPQSPNRLRPDRHPEAARQARDRVLQKMLQAGLIDAGQYRRALEEVLPRQRHAMAGLIPHTAWHYRMQDPARFEWHTTLDENIQRRTQTLLRHYIATLQSYQISNAAAVVIDNKTREVRAVVGSLDYFDQAAQGANDGARMARSPGSTLKPFLYGLALQEGLISERTILYDIPVNYAGYAPRNYSKEFLGPVSAHEALTESLNVVAVRLSQELGVQKLHGLLQAGGLSSVDKPAQYYGLPLVLGGVETRLIELTNLYASLANDGVYQPYTLLRDADAVKAEPVRLLSSEATWLITHILTDVERPDFPASWQYSAHRPTIAWKTGTSYGHQDAWSIGYTQAYTIGVWVGNFDGAPSNGLAGSHTAAPILFDLFQALDTGNKRAWFEKPDGVQTRQVCAVCGRLASRHCQSLISEFYIVDAKGPATESVCQIPQSLAIDTRSGLQANSDTPKAAIAQRVFNIWPAEMAQFLLRHGIPVRQAPPYDAQQMAGQKYYPPQILSPVKNAIYYKRLDKLETQDHGIKLSAAVTNRVRKVFWFLDKTLIAQGDPIEEVIVNPPPGRYRLSLVDDTGGSDEIELIVKDYREIQAQR